MPKVSIVTISHNYAHYLGDCIASVAKQTYRDFEHVVVDAASTDDTSNVMDGWQRSGVLQMRCLQFGAWGLVRPKNFGMANAEGEYIVNLDADDTIHPQFLEKLVAQAGPKTIVCPGLKEIGGQNAGWPTWGVEPADFLSGNRIFCCSMFPKRAWLEVGGYDAQLDSWGYEDWELWIKLLKNGCKVKVVPELLFNYRVLPGTHAGENTRKTEEWHAQRVAYIKMKHAV